MVSTGTRTASTTITEARYVAAKIGADLRQLNGLYGSPKLSQIDDYVEEAALLLRDGYLGSVLFGFKNPVTDECKFRLKFVATLGGQLIDSRPGSLPAGADIANCTFFSFLTYSDKYDRLPLVKQVEVKAGLPIVRVDGKAPSENQGSETTGNGYSCHEVGVSRSVFVASP